MKLTNESYKFEYEGKHTKIGYKIYGNKNKKIFIFFNDLMRSDYIFYPIIKSFLIQLLKI